MQTPQDAICPTHQHKKVSQIVIPQSQYSIIISVSWPVNQLVLGVEFGLQLDVRIRLLICLDVLQPSARIRLVALAPIS